MSQLKRSQVRVIEEAMAYPRGLGYVLDFSDRTILEYFEDEFEIDFDERKYKANGTSKRKRLLTFIGLESPYTVTKVLRALWDRREGLIRKAGGPVNKVEEDEIRRIYLEAIANIEGSVDIP